MAATQLTDASGRVEMWRGGCRLNMSVAASFDWRCLSGSTMAPFPHPAHRTGQGDFPHPALGQDFTPCFRLQRHLQFLNTDRAATATRQEWRALRSRQASKGACPRSGRLIPASPGCTLRPGGHAALRSSSCFCTHHHRNATGENPGRNLVYGVPSCGASFPDKQCRIRASYH